MCVKNVFLARGSHLSARGGAWFVRAPLLVRMRRNGVFGADGISEGSFSRESGDRHGGRYGDRESHYEGASGARMPRRHLIQEDGDTRICGGRNQPHPLRRCGRGCTDTTPCIPVSVQYPERRTGVYTLEPSNQASKTINKARETITVLTEEQKGV